MDIVRLSNQPHTAMNCTGAVDNRWPQVRGAQSQQLNTRHVKVHVPNPQAVVMAAYRQLLRAALQHSRTPAA